jgi:hypothetical protein
MDCNLVEINPACYKIHDDFIFNRDKVIVTLNYDSDMFIYDYIKSLYKFCDKNDFTLIIFDNSELNKLNIDLLLYRLGLTNILYLDNTKNPKCCDKQGLINFTTETILYKGSYEHCRTVDWIIQNILFKNRVSGFLLTDSDVIFKKNPFEIIDTDYCTVGEKDELQNRINPYLQYINLQRYKQYGLSYYDENNMIFLTSEDWRNADTGCGYYKKLIDKQLPIKTIDINDYIIHYHHGSWKSITDVAPYDKFKNILNWHTSNREFL